MSDVTTQRNTGKYKFGL